MAKKKKKGAPAKGKNAPATLNDEKYLSSGRARSLPIYKCVINEHWEEDGMAEIFVSRKHVNGHVTVGVYLVDTFCTGVKSTFYYFNTTEEKFEDLLTSIPVDMEDISYELAHNIIYGAIAYAQEYGIAPHPEFQLTQMILEEDTEDVELIELEFGRNGKPALLINPAGDPRAEYYLRQLEKHAGPGNYDVVDGRLGEALDDDFEDDLDDDYYAFPEDWDEGDWEEFIDETEPEELINFIEAAGYMYDKTVAAPTQAVDLLTSDLEHVGMAITYEPLQNNYSDEELSEAAQIIATVKASVPSEQTNPLDILKPDYASDKPGTGLLKPKDNSESVLKQTVERLQQNIKKWPENPIFWNYLAMTYQQLGEDEKAEETIIQLHEQFPDYLHGKIMYAELLLDQEKADEVPAVFNNQFNLKGVYPNRDMFHISELVMFNFLMADYYLEEGNLYMANMYVKMLDQMEIPDSVSLNMLLLMRVNVALVKEMAPVLQEAKQSEEKKRELIAQLVN
ncbi:tetratricopeptide repeat protein [Pontibacter pamirensis]|uniref:hypothetical protein n=1 Tax=Pontibacter pamirensis TaxID=2562824 RepID=UPI001389F362|nr:hypothetical protein [Pontibacter pamirensis]